jgi:hypothetical protein
LNPSRGGMRSSFGSLVIVTRRNNPSSIHGCIPTLHTTQLVRVSYGHSPFDRTSRTQCTYPRKQKRPEKTVHTFTGVSPNSCTPCVAALFLNFIQVNGQFPRERDRRTTFGNTAIPGPHQYLISCFQRETLANRENQGSCYSYQQV